MSGAALMGQGEKEPKRMGSLKGAEKDGEPKRMGDPKRMGA